VAIAADVEQYDLHMKLQEVIPAVVASARDGLDLTAVRLDGLDADKWQLTTANGGSVLLELGKVEGRFIFGPGELTHGKMHLHSAFDKSARAFVDAIAEWLGFELAEAKEKDDAREPNAQLECSWVRLGEGLDALNNRWTGFKLFLKLGERYAEVFFRSAQNGKRAQFVEKWSAYRRELVEIMERAIAKPPARSVRERRTSRAPKREGALSFGIHQAFDLELPAGWLLREEKKHYRITDPNEEMMIEFSHMRLPPLPPDTPGVVERVQIVVDNSGHRDTALPVATFEKNGVTYAWSEYRLNSRNTKDPKAPPRPARERCLIAANAWIQVLVTGCWWETDTAVAEQAWNGVVDSLEVAGRISPSLETRGNA